MNHYPHHIGDFDRATRHLSRLERSIYRDLIELYYDTEQQLSLDMPALCRRILARSAEEVTAVEQTLNEFFTKTPTGWYHDRCEEEIARYKASNSQKAEAGRASAAAKALRKQQALNVRGSGDSTAVEQANNGTSTNQEPITKNQQPIIKNQRSDKSDVSIDLVREVFVYWQTVMDSPKSILDSKREAIIRKSLKLGYTPEDLRAAIDGCRRTPHNMGLNDRGSKYNGLDLILRDADHIDRFIATPAHLEVITSGPYQPAARQAITDPSTPGWADDPEFQRECEEAYQRGRAGHQGL